MKKRVGILEDNFSLRTNIEQYLNIGNAYEIVFSAANTKDICTMQLEHAPDVILLDIHLQGQNSLELITCMKERFPNVAIVIMTGDSNQELIMQAFENGANGYIYKPFKLIELTDTIKKLETDGSYMQPLVATKLISMLKKKDLVAELQEEFNLTNREAEIVRGIQEGLSYKQIGEKLFISHYTVNHHLKNVYLKVDVTSRTELVANYLTAQKRAV